MRRGSGAGGSSGNSHATTTATTTPNDRVSLTPWGTPRPSVSEIGSDAVSRSSRMHAGWGGGGVKDECREWTKTEFNIIQGGIAH